MLTLALAATLAHAEPLPTHSPEGRELPRLSQTADLEVSRYFSAFEESSFRRVNRLPAVGSLMMGTGVTAAVFGLGMSGIGRIPGPISGEVVAATLFVGGVGATLTSPFLSGYGAFRAASMLRKCGVRAPVGFAVAGVVVGALTPFTVGLSLPLVEVLFLAQSALNRTAFIRHYHRPPQPRSLRVIPVATAVGSDRPALGLAGTW